MRVISSAASDFKFRFTCPGCRTTAVAALSDVRYASGFCVACPGCHRSIDVPGDSMSEADLRDVMENRVDRYAADAWAVLDS